MSQWRFVAVLAALPGGTAGCGNVNVRLADADLSAAVVDGEQNVLALMVAVTSPPCPIFPDVRATQDGVPMDQFSPGGKMLDEQGVVPGLFIPVGDTICGQPAWILQEATSDSAITVFELADDSATITMDVKNINPSDAGYAFVDPSTSTLHPDEVVEMAWHPDTDTLIADGLQIDIWFDDMDAWDQHLRNDDSTAPSIAVAGPTLQFQLPPPAAFNIYGTATLIVIGDVNHEVERCDGVTECAATNFYASAPEMAITMEP